MRLETLGKAIDTKWIELAWEVYTDSPNEEKTNN